MKALVVTPYYHPKIGGLENYARQLNIAMHKLKGWEIVVITTNHEAKNDCQDKQDGFKVYRLGPWFKLSNTPVNPLFPLKIRSIINREKPDVILAHTPVPSMADAAALASGKTPFILFYHASTLLKSGSTLFNLIARVYGLYQMLTFNKATRIVAVADYVKQQFPKSLMSKTRVVPNSIWNNQIANQAPNKGTNFLFIGSLDKTHAWKGLDDIIKSMSIYKNRYGDKFQLTVLGDGNYRSHYEQLAKDLNVEKQIKFVGAQFGAAKDRALKSASVLICYPTTSNDAFPTVFLEAWANNLPVVAAKIGSIPSIIKDGQNGRLVKPNDPESLADMVRSMSTMNTKNRQLLTNNAADLTRLNYTWEHQASILEKIVGSVT